MLVHRMFFVKLFGVVSFSTLLPSGHNGKPVEVNGTFLFILLLLAERVFSGLASL
jgi:hypothetical protein